MGYVKISDLQQKTTSSLNGSEDMLVTSDNISYKLTVNSMSDYIKNKTLYESNLLYTNSNIINDITVPRLFVGGVRKDWTKGISAFTGAICIEITGLYHQANMNGMMNVHILEVGSTKLAKCLNISGQWNNSNSQWDYGFAVDPCSTAEMKIRFSRDTVNSKVYVILGELNTIWTNVRISIEIPLSSYVHGLNLGFNIGTLSSFSGITTDIYKSIDLKITKNIDIVSGSGTKITYDSKGLITSSTILSAADIPVLDASKITTGTLPVVRGGTGVTTSTGTGNVVLSTSPTLVTPNIGVATGSLTGNASTATTLQTARTIAITGDLSYTSGTFNGSANVTGIGTLSNTGVTTGTYRSVTTDAKGRITAGTNPTTISGYGITDAYTKTEIDNIAQGLNAKASVIVASTSNIAINTATTTIDGVTITVNDRVLIKDQTTASQNGIYTNVTSTSWVRSTDANSEIELKSAFVFVDKGTTNADTAWVQTNDIVIIGTTNVNWVKFAGAGAYAPLSHTHDASHIISGTINGTSFNGTADIIIGQLNGSNYIGTGVEKPNNTVFGAGKFRYQMLSSSNLGTGRGAWNDVLWTSSYTGADVKGSNAIVMGKDYDYIGFSRSNFDATAWTTPKEILHSGNYNSFVYTKAEIDDKLKYDISSTEFISDFKRAGSIVYGIEINAGLLVNAAIKEVAFTFNGSYNYWIDNQNSYCYNSNESYPINYTGNIGESIFCFLDKINNKIKISCSNDKSAFTGKIVLLYTK